MDIHFILCEENHCPRFSRKLVSCIFATSLRLFELTFTNMTGTLSYIEPSYLFNSYLDGLVLWAPQGESVMASLDIFQNVKTGIG